MNKDSVKVPHSYTYDSGCTHGKGYDKNGKALTYMYEPFKNLKTTKGKRRKKLKEEIKSKQ